jgi:predicted small lipoprotein YifL
MNSTKTVKNAFIAVVALLILWGCGLKGDLTYPVPQNQTEAQQNDTSSQEQK